MELKNNNHGQLLLAIVQLGFNYVHAYCYMYISCSINLGSVGCTCVKKASEAEAKANIIAKEDFMITVYVQIFEVRNFHGFLG